MFSPETSMPATRPGRAMNILTRITHLWLALDAMLRLLRQLQRALLPVFALPADLFAALQLQSQFSDLLEEKRNITSANGRSRSSHGGKISIKTVKPEESYFHVRAAIND